MTATDAKKARRDARELAATRPADPYRGALADPYTAAAAPASAAAAAAAGQQAAGGYPAEAGEPRSEAARHDRAGNRVPAPAVMAGILAIGLGAVLGLFGLLLLAIISLENEYGAPDRSFYQGSDSSYLLLSLLDFVMGACLLIGGIAFLTGRVVGRLAVTVAGWTVLAVSGFWWLQAGVTRLVPLVLAVLALGMLALSYQASVTRWLGVLPAAQPE